MIEGTASAHRSRIFVELSKIADNPETEAGFGGEREEEVRSKVRGMDMLTKSLGELKRSEEVTCLCHLTH